LPCVRTESVGPPSSSPSPPSGAPAQFTADRLGGGELSSASFAGKVEVVGVAGRGEVAEMEGFVSDTSTGDLTHVVDADGAVWSAYDVFAQPACAFIDDSGSVEVFVGALGEKGLVERMNALAEA